MTAIAATKGRTVIVKRNAVVVAGVRTKNITINGSPIDVTTDDDAGVRALLDTPGQVDVSISVSGIVLSDTLRTEALGTTDRTQITQFLYGSASPDNGWTGNFFLASYKETGEYQGAITFEAEFQSAGAVTYA